jgi:hypothetical protein
MRSPDDGVSPAPARPSVRAIQARNSSGPSLRSESVTASWRLARRRPPGPSTSGTWAYRASGRPRTARAGSGAASSPRDRRPSRPRPYLARHHRPLRRAGTRVYRRCGARRSHQPSHRGTRAGDPRKLSGHPPNGLEVPADVRLPRVPRAGPPLDCGRCRGNDRRSSCRAARMPRPRSPPACSSRGRAARWHRAVL